MTTFVPYQVDYSTKNTSKTFGFSKKKVSFKFGFANNEALSQGLTGAHCRGSEHEIIFIWSLNSGKRQILADGKDVHYSESGQNGWTADQIFQHQFSLRIPSLSATLRCHLITQPVNRDLPGQRPFDLRVNGISFFTFSKIFQLGTSSMVARPVKGSKSRSRGGGGGGGGGGGSNYENDPYVTPEERKAIAAAKLESLKDLKQTQKTEAAPASSSAAGSNMPREEGSLISFDDPTPPAQPPNAAHFMSSVTMDPAIRSTSSFDQGQQQQHQQQQAYSNYALTPQQQQQQQQQQQSNALTTYQQPNPQQQQPYYQAPPMQAPPTPQQHQQPQYGAPPTPQQYQQPQYGAPPTPPQHHQQQYNSAPPPTYGQTQQAFGFASPPPAAGHAQQMTSPSNQTANTFNSAASYGSAPSFAQPPQQRQQQQQQYQQQPGYPQPNYGQQPPQQQGYSQPHY